MTPPLRVVRFSGRRVKCLAFAALMVCATNCASPGPMPLNRAALRASQPRTIVATVPPVPSFKGHTSGSGVAAAFGLVGLAIMEGMAESEGKAVRSRGVVDPADPMVSALMPRLAKRFSLEILDSGTAKTRGKSATQLSREYGKADLVLDIRTHQWGFGPTGMGRYGMRYDGSLQLIDSRNQTVIAHGICQYQPDDDPNAPTYDQLMANDAAVLRASLTAMMNYCLDDYRKRILGLYDQ
jgi:hypothetical protein